MPHPLASAGLHVLVHVPGFTIPCGVLNLNKLKSLLATYPLSVVPVLIQVPLSNERLQTSCFLQDLDRDKWKNTLA